MMVWGDARQLSSSLLHWITFEMCSQPLYIWSVVSLTDALAACVFAQACAYLSAHSWFLSACPTPMGIRKKEPPSSMAAFRVQAGRIRTFFSVAQTNPMKPVTARSAAARLHSASVSLTSPPRTAQSSIYSRLQQEMEAGSAEGVLTSTLFPLNIHGAWVWTRFGTHWMGYASLFKNSTYRRRQKGPKKSPKRITADRLESGRCKTKIDSPSFFKEPYNCALGFALPSWWYWQS